MSDKTAGTVSSILVPSAAKKERELQQSESYFKLTQSAANDVFGGMDRNGLSLKIVNLHKYDPTKNRKKIIASEFERHEGWIESIKHEKKQIME
jgi:hypothetical protein